MAIRVFNGVMPELADDVYVDDSAVVIGDVSIGADSSIWPMAVVRGDVNRIEIGRMTNIQDGSVLHVTHASPFGGGAALSIGDSVTVGHNAVIHACTVEDFCLIGMSATLMDGAIVHEENMVAAGSLVPPGKELESGYLWLGSPVRRARPLTDDEKQYLRYSAEHYVRLKNQYQMLTD